MPCVYLPGPAPAVTVANSSCYRFYACSGSTTEDEDDRGRAGTISHPREDSSTTSKDDINQERDAANSSLLLTLGMVDETMELIEVTTNEEDIAETSETIKDDASDTTGKADDTVDVTFTTQASFTDDVTTLSSDKEDTTWKTDVTTQESEVTTQYAEDIDVTTEAGGAEVDEDVEAVVSNLAASSVLRAIRNYLFVDY